MGREKEMPLLARLCCFVLTFEATLGQRFQSLTGTAGQAVSLPCGSDNGCTWRKDGKELALDERSDQARFNIGSCALTIEPLLPGDVQARDAPSHGPARRCEGDCLGIEFGEADND